MLDDDQNHEWVTELLAQVDWREYEAYVEAEGGYPEPPAPAPEEMELFHQALSRPLSPWSALAYQGDKLRRRTWRKLLRAVVRRRQRGH